MQDCTGSGDDSSEVASRNGHSQLGGAVASDRFGEAFVREETESTMQDSDQTS